MFARNARAHDSPEPSAHAICIDSLVIDRVAGKAGAVTVSFLRANGVAVKNHLFHQPAIEAART